MILASILARGIHAIRVLESHVRNLGRFQLCNIEKHSLKNIKDVAARNCSMSILGLQYWDSSEVAVSGASNPHSSTPSLR